METLKLSNVSKTYSNGVKALDEVSIEIKPGMFGLLGPNGAGKSTLMRTIATLQEPDSGEMYLGDMNILKDKMALRKVVGYLPQDFGVYPKLSAEKLLHYFAQLKGVQSKKDRQKIVEFALDVTNLSEVRNKSVAGYSGGMKQRFGIAQLLLNDPHLIIVDEPTAGLDPAERHRFLNVLRDIGTDHIVILSTHIVDDVKELCTDMAVLNGGNLLNHSKPIEAINELEGKIWNKVIHKDELESYSQTFDIISRNYNQDHSLNIRVFSKEKPDDTFLVIQPDLSDVYFVSLKMDETKMSNV
jgi:ABC-type multidrug transport system ATPase subunit